MKNNNSILYERLKELACNFNTKDKIMLILYDFNEKSFIGYSFRTIYDRINSLNFEKTQMKYMISSFVKIDDYIFALKCIIENQNLVISNTQFTQEEIDSIPQDKENGCFYLFSSGTTKRKIIELSYDKLIENTFKNYTADSNIGTFWSMTSLSAISGITSSICYPIITGNTSISFFPDNIANIPEMINRFKINTVTMGNLCFHYSYMIPNDSNCPTLRKINFAGGLISKNQINEIRNKFKNKEIKTGLVYGSTEGYGRITYSDDDEYQPIYLDLSKIQDRIVNVLDEEYYFKNVKSDEAYFNFQELISCGKVKPSDFRIKIFLNYDFMIDGELKESKILGEIIYRGVPTGDIGFILNHHLYVIGRKNKTISFYENGTIKHLYTDIIQIFLNEKLNENIFLFKKNNMLYIKSDYERKKHIRDFRIIKRIITQTKKEKEINEFVKNLRWFPKKIVKLDSGPFYFTKELGKYVPTILFEEDRQRKNKYRTNNYELVEINQKNKRR